MILVLIWTLTAAVGAAFALFGLREAVRDYWAIRPVYNGRRRLAVVSMTKMTIKFVITLSWFLIGVVYLGQSIDTRVSAAGIVLILTNMGVALLVVLDYYERRKTVTELTARFVSGEAHQAATDIRLTEHTHPVDKEKS